MGTGASKKKTFRQRVRVIEALRARSTSHCVTNGQKVTEDDSKAGRDTSGNGTLTFTDTSQAWRLLQEGQICDPVSLPRTTLRIDDFKNVRRKSTLREEDNASVDIPYEQSIEVPADDLCHICGVYTGDVTYPCRICTHVYHESCLHKIGQCQDPNSVCLLRRALEKIGWSCHVCDNLSRLLTDSEMKELIDIFDKYDLNKDCSISEEEFLKYRQAKYKDEIGESMTDSELEYEKLKFKLMDLNATGVVDWWEFLNYESIRVLARRSKNSLVRILTEREIAAARDTFRYFDVDGNGQITEYEAHKSFHKWYSRFYNNETGGGDGTMKESSALAKHISENTKLMMAADTDGSGGVSWSEFVKDQVLYILASRPNSSSDINTVHATSAHC